MPSIATYEPIATSTLGSASAGYTFTSVPSTYTDLVIVVQEPNTSSGSNEHGLQFNSDIGNTSNTNYTWAGWVSNGSATAHTTSTGYYKFNIGGQVASETTHIYIYDYANTSYFKGIEAEGQVIQSGTNRMFYWNGNWKNTAAITSIRIDTWGSQYSYLFAAGTVFSLYGIKAG